MMFAALILAALGSVAAAAAVASARAPRDLAGDAAAAIDSVRRQMFVIAASPFGRRPSFDPSKVHRVPRPPKVPTADEVRAMVVEVAKGRSSSLQRDASKFEQDTARLWNLLWDAFAANYHVNPEKTGIPLDQRLKRIDGILAIAINQDLQQRNAAWFLKKRAERMIRNMSAPESHKAKLRAELARTPKTPAALAGFLVTQVGKRALTLNVEKELGKWATKTEGEVWLEGIALVAAAAGAAT